MKKWFLVLLVFAVMFVGCQQSKTNSANNSEAKLTLLASSTDLSQPGSITIKGQIKNTSTDQLDNVDVYLKSYDDNRQLLATEKAPIEIRSLTPDQISSFQVTMKDNRAAVRHLITFTTESGKEIKFLQDGKINKGY